MTPPTANAVSSTQSTPSRKPAKRSQSRDFADVETDEMILKRMEEILFTYKNKVEDRLAAEGKELPKDIFQDFTEHWINSSPYRAKSVDSLSEKSSSDKSVRGGGGSAMGRKAGIHDRSPADWTETGGGRTLPKNRRDTKEGHGSTKIPVPTFYKNTLS